MVHQCRLAVVEVDCVSPERRRAEAAGDALTPNAVSDIAKLGAVFAEVRDQVYLKRQGR